MRKASRKDHRRAIARSRRDDGALRFVDDPPRVVHLDDTQYGLDDVEAMLDDYAARASLTIGARSSAASGCSTWRTRGGRGQRRHAVLDLPDGGVGPPEGRPDHPPGEGGPGVGARAVRRRVDARASRPARRCRAATAGASDMFLGWCEGPSGRHYYVRQLWDSKGRSDLLAMDHRNLTYHGALCGWALAWSHVWSGDAIQIAAYLGGRDDFDRAVASYSAEYARTTRRRPRPVAGGDRCRRRDRERRPLLRHRDGQPQRHACIPAVRTGALRGAPGGSSRCGSRSRR